MCAFLSGSLCCRLPGSVQCDSQSVGSSVLAWSIWLISNACRQTSPSDLTWKLWWESLIVLLSKLAIIFHGRWISHFLKISIILVSCHKCNVIPPSFFFLFSRLPRVDWKSDCVFWKRRSIFLLFPSSVSVPGSGSPDVALCGRQQRRASEGDKISSRVVDDAVRSRHAVVVHAPCVWAPARFSTWRVQVNRLHTSTVYSNFQKSYITHRASTANQVTRVSQAIILTQVSFSDSFICKWVSFLAKYPS